MDNELCLKLIEFNKREPEVFNETEVIKPKIRGGLRLFLYYENYMSADCIFPEYYIEDYIPRKPNFWNEIEEQIDGKEHLPEFREEFSKNYTSKQLLEAIRDLYMKPGNIYNRKMIYEKPAELPIDSSIYCWSEKDSSNARSNMIFYFANNDFRGSVYSVKSEQDLNSLVEIIRKENKIPQPF